ncbi:MAG: Histidinol-phosphate aminotransferase [Syntrophus sp. SKADARSKE-3]|nr:Histidinol-phosphate aminotransferase [Syntrophus sp. SKADARSKE-3]
MTIEKWIRKEILAQKAYAVGPQDCPVKIDAMENPYVLPPASRQALFDRLKNVLLNRYPEAGALRLRSRYAGYFGVDETMLTIGNGSDELITILCTALSVPPSTVLIPVPTFAVYRIVALNQGHRVLEVPLDENYDLDLPAMLEMIHSEQPALIFLSNPNNPTGNCFTTEKIEAIIKASPGIVVVDEAYFPFSGKTIIPLLKTYENLVVLRTLSKVGLAAIRVGFLMGAAPLVEELDKVRLPYNINSLSQVVADFFLDEQEVFADQARKIIQSREDLFAELSGLKGIHPFQSDANFIFFSCDFNADSIYGHLLKKGIMIKNLNAPGRMKNTMRVTIGTRKENAQFMEALRECLTSRGA